MPIAFEITHPFHPQRGARFVMTARHKAWGEDRVLFFDARGRLHSLLTSWTDVPVPDAFALASARRSWFRVDDLLRLGALLDQAMRKDSGVK